MIPMLVRAAMALVVLYLGLANWVLIRAAANGNRDALIVVPGIILLSGFVLWDLTSILDPGFSRVFLARAAYSGRSEEHTSELQSLMRISYAVFCLKTKTH